MSNFSAFIPVAQMEAANQALEDAHFGPRNFSVPAYDGPAPAYAVFHCWPNAAFRAAVEALPGVVIRDAEPLPADQVNALLAGVSAGWGGNTPLLEGNVTPGLHRDDEGALWWVIQPYDTTIWPDPTAIPALIRRARVPGEVQPWAQPLDQFDAYKLVNPFTGEPDRVTHNGSDWEVSQADGAGNNVWEPGAFGWVQV